MRVATTTGNWEPGTGNPAYRVLCTFRCTCHVPSAMRYVLCAMCYALYALCSVLCAMCSVLSSLPFARALVLFRIH